MDNVFQALGTRCVYFKEQNNTTQKKHYLPHKVCFFESSTELLCVTSIFYRKLDRNNKKYLTVNFAYLLPTLYFTELGLTIENVKNTVLNISVE